MRRKIGKAIEDGGDLPDLTEQQRKFVEGVLMGKTLTDSYRAAYDCSGMVPSTIWPNASRLRADSNIAAWIAAARKAHFGVMSRTKDQHIARLAELGEIAVETGQPYERVVTDTERNFWMGAEEALTYGLISRIITSASEV